MKRLFILIILLASFSCKKDSEDPINQTPKTFCWQCRQVFTTQITDCDRTWQEPSEVVITLPCNMTENDALAYEKSLTGQSFVTTGKRKMTASDPPCNYYSVFRWWRTTCKKLGVN